MSNEQNLAQLIEQFNEHFSNQQLDEVMNFFAEDCEFRELSGKVAKGKAAIRKAFKPLFAGTFGKAEFIAKNLIIDEAKREATFVWSCQHDLREKPEGLSKLASAVFSALRLSKGPVCYWEGIDYFIFDADYKIVSKQSYGKAATPKFIKGEYRGARL